MSGQFGTGNTDTFFIPNQSWGQFPRENIQVSPYQNFSSSSKTLKESTTPRNKKNYKNKRSSRISTNKIWVTLAIVGLVVIILAVIAVIVTLLTINNNTSSTSSSASSLPTTDQSLQDNIITNTVFDGKGNTNKKVGEEIPKENKRQNVEPKPTFIDVEPVETNDQNDELQDDNDIPDALQIAMKIGVQENSVLKHKQNTDIKLRDKRSPQLELPKSEDYESEREDANELEETLRTAAHLKSLENGKKNAGVFIKRD